MRNVHCKWLCLIVLVTGCGGSAGHSPDDEGAWFEDAYAESILDKHDNVACSGVFVPDRPGFGKRLALTFDDGPNPATTPDVMAVLRRFDIPATFFINGSRVGSEETRAMVQEIADDPQFILANHSQNHLNLSKVGLEEATSEVDATTAVIATAGVEPEYFRFPFGAATCGAAEMVRARGYAITGWHVDSADWCFARHGTCPRSIFKHIPDEFRADMQGWVLTQARRRDGGIVLFHDIHRDTADSLAGVIEALIEDGFTFVSIDDLDAFPLLNGTTPVSRGFIGDSCETDEDCEFDDGFCIDDAVDGGICTRACETSCPDRQGYPFTRCVAASPTLGELSNVCVVGCDFAGECREALSCQIMSLPTGPDHDVCWLPEG